MAKTQTESGEYNTAAVEAARTGWIVREKGRTTEMFIRWSDVIRHLALRLTSEGDK